MKSSVAHAALLALALQACSATPPPGPPPPSYDPAGAPPRGTASASGAGEPVASGAKPTRTEAHAAGDGTLAPTSAPDVPRLGPFRRVFATKIDGWNQQVVIAPWGDPVALSGSGELRLVARDTGATLLRVDACAGQGSDAATFVDDRHLLVACEAGVREVTFPEGSVRARFTYPFHDPHRLKAAAFGGGRLVTAVGNYFDGGRPDTRVRVFAAADGKLVDEFDPGKQVEKLAISSEGTRVAVSFEGPGLLVRELATKVSRSWLETSGAGVHGMRFAPGGATLFGNLATFEAGELDLATGAVRRSSRIGSWLTATRHLPSGDVLASGSDGLWLFPKEGAATSLRDIAPAEGLDVTADGSFFCTAGRDGALACYATGPVAPSTFVPAAGTPPPATGGASPSSDGSNVPPLASLEGTIAAHSGASLVVSAPGATSTRVGARGRLFKPLVLNLGVLVSGRLEIATVEVTAVAEGRLTLAILAERSLTVVNGKKVDHFTPKTPVTVELE